MIDMFEILQCILSSHNSPKIATFNSKFIEIIPKSSSTDLNILIEIFF